jgi:deaminated glutathione amidase
VKSALEIEETLPGLSRELDVAAIQLSSQESLGENLTACAGLVESAAERGAKLVVLPENFAFMGEEKTRVGMAEAIGDPNAPIQKAISDIARRNAVHVVAGGMPEKSEDAARPFNTCAVFDPTGALVSSYRKIHLFDVDLEDGTSLRESSNTTPGQLPVVLRIGTFSIGLSICYDLRFPELYRELVSAGAEILLVPAAFTLHTGKDHWHVLLRARAIEAQSYVVAAAQFGKHPLGRTTYGHSLIADPWGTVIAEASDGLGFAIGTIDAGKLTSVRNSLPSLKHRKL